jgi:hypothetical protein
MAPMVELGPIGPVDPTTGRHPNTPASELINYWTHGPGSEPLRKPAAERTYSYVQEPRSFAECVLRRKRRRRRYLVRVTEDRAGRRVAHTERFDPERGSGPNLTHVDIRPLPWTIGLPMVIFAAAVFVILMIVLPFPLNLIIGTYWAWSLSSRMYSAVERARMTKYLRRLPDDLPPLLSAEELDARLLTLANPDEDHSFEDPAPIPLPALLRHRAWQVWEERHSEAAVRKLGYSFLDHPEDHEHVRLDAETRALAGRTRLRLTTSRQMNEAIKAAYGVSHQTKEQIAALDAEFDDLALRFGCVLLDIEHPRMLTAPPQLDRPFTTETDCADGHVGEHPIIAVFVDRLGRQRVTRACKWCPSEWSDLV